MKAAVCTAYGTPDVLQIKTIDIPVPKENEILIKVMASTVAAADYRVRGFKVPLAMWIPARLIMGLTKPKCNVLGAEFSGVVCMMGESAQRFNVGDEILGVSLPKFGGYAEYLCIKDDGPIVKKPKEINWNKAATLPIGAKTAHFYLKKANLQKGHKILIYGASGSVGTYAIQLAKRMGAKVTAVCSTQNFELVKQLGAETVIDYHDRNWYKSLKEYDIFFEAVDKCPFSITKHILKKEGTYINISSPFASLGRLSVKFRKKLHFILAKDFPQSYDDLEYLVGLAKKGELQSVIDKTFTLDNIVKAHQYADLGHKKGNVAITVGN